jgi:ribose 5-phosphate isomerase A
LPTDPAKAAAAARALELVKPGMVVGLGTGSTAELFVRGLGLLVAGGLQVVGVPTSRATAEIAVALGIPIVTDLDQPIDLAVDGADEVDPQMRLVKGGGGAFFREKLVAAAARRFVVVADESKMVERLGRGPLPVEVLPYLWRLTARRLEGLGAVWLLRGGEERPYVTDNGNLILDLTFATGMDDPEGLASALKATLGVLEHGLFGDMAAAVIVGAPNGGVRILGSLEPTPPFGRGEA